MWASQREDLCLSFLSTQMQHGKPRHSGEGGTVA